MDLLTIPDVADALGTDVLAVHRLIKEGEVVELRVDGVRKVPADFVQDGALVKLLRAVIQLLRDAKYSDEEIVDWLFREDESLPGTPIRALRENRGTEVKRRAQAAGF